MSRRPRRRPPKRGGKAPSRPVEAVTIRSLGRQGDGESVLVDGTRVFVPFTVPGESVRVRPTVKRGDGFAAEIEERLSGASETDPVCPLFGRCGGCQVQHLTENDYVTWKTQAVEKALSRHGITVPLEPLRRVPLDSRRRIRMSAVKTAQGLVMGFNAARSGVIQNVDACPLLIPELQALIAPVRALIDTLLPGGGRADVAMSVPRPGVKDVLIETDAEFDLEAREAIVAAAERFDIARIASAVPGQEPLPILQRLPVTAETGGVAVELPIGSFQQPSKAGERVLRELVQLGIADAAHIADLFCGIGTFSLPVAVAGAQVLAVDNGSAAIAALDLCAGRAGLGGRIETEVRDLFSRPLDAKTLNRFDAVVFDPPRAGAAEQALALAESEVPVIVAVSCNPATLGRDLKSLVDSGYEIEKVVPVDQFPMTYHVEAVAYLRRSA
jgi:23S rRNA (uracil1939-C5)-methyltransferase